MGLSLPGTGKYLARSPRLVEVLHYFFVKNKIRLQLYDGEFR